MRPRYSLLRLAAVHLLEECIELRRDSTLLPSKKYTSIAVCQHLPQTYEPYANAVHTFEIIYP